MPLSFNRARALGALTLALCLLPALSRADSYTYTADAQTRPSRELYTASRVLTGQDTGAGEFDMPEDVCWYDGQFYVADTGNDRVVILDSDLRFVREIDTPIVDGDDDSFFSPSGLFAGERGLLVCDKNNKRLLLLNQDDEAVIEYTKPSAQALAGVTFKPEKAVMDSFGNAYVLAGGVYQGLLMFTPEGEFGGFFGANVIQADLSVIVSRFWKSFFSKEASETMARSIPIEYSNVVIDAEDFIYASIFQTESGSGNLKKLNALGKNILSHPDTGTALDMNRYGDLQGYTYKGAYYRTRLIDAAVDDMGVVTVLDGTWARLFQYDADGNLLGTFGGPGDRAGLFSAPSAVVFADGRYIVLDKVKGTLTVFEETPYRALLSEALRSYAAGEYQASIDTWREVLKYDAGMTMAYKSIGKAYMQQGQWEQALQNLRVAGDRESYSLVLGNVRRAFIREHFVWLLLGAVVLVVGAGYALRAFKRYLGLPVRQKRRRGA